jgi:dihydroceramidase
MRFVRPLTILVLITFVLVPLTWLPAPWAGWRPATCLPDACFCEPISDGFIRQPMNTWSNLAFVLVGLLILEDVLRPASTRSNLLAQRRTYGVIYGTAVILIGLGSWFYHASLTFIGQWFDVMGMYLLGTFMVLYNIARLLASSQVMHPYASWKGVGTPFVQMTGRIFALGYVLFNIVLGLSLIIVPELRRYLFGMLLVVTIALEVIIRYRSRGFSRNHSGYTDRLKPQIQTGYFIVALLIYVLAQIIWTLDLNHSVCDPHGVLQGHAAWHVLTALSAGLLYLYYRSERTDLSGDASEA